MSCSLTAGHHIGQPHCVVSTDRLQYEVTGAENRAWWQLSFFSFLCLIVLRACVLGPTRSGHFSDADSFTDQLAVLTAERVT
jgi:hypothetical protein